MLKVSGEEVFSFLENVLAFHEVFAFSKGALKMSREMLIVSCKVFTVLSKCVVSHEVFQSSVTYSPSPRKHSRCPEKC